MATHITAHDEHVLPSAGLLARSKEVEITWLQRARTRRELAELPPHLLKDIGLTEADRFVESNKPFWRN